jgi:dipeptidyl-peptidase 4
MGSADFPRRFARTGRFRYGEPQDFTVAPDGRRVVYLRSAAGTDPVTRLWVLDLDSGCGRERLIANPAALLGGHAEDLSAQEQTRRERSRQDATGIVAYSTDRRVRQAVFALSGRLWSADLISGTVAEISTSGPGASGPGGGGPGAGGPEASMPGAVIDPRIDPSGGQIGYIRDGALRVVGLDGGGDRELAGPEGPQVSYGLAEHVAAEEMGRSRGFWWSPDGSRLLVARADTSQVQRWYLADPANPQLPPRPIAYPAAGTANADVSLWLIGLDGDRIPVAWDTTAFEYLVAACWGGPDPDPLIVVQSRDQRTVRILQVDEGTGRTRLVHEELDDCWVNVAPGVPALTACGALVWIAPAGDSYRLVVGGVPVTPPGLQVRAVLAVDGDTVLFSASQDPADIQLWAHDSGSGAVRLTSAAGVHDGTRAGDVTVVTEQSLEHDGTRVRVQRGDTTVAEIASRAEFLGLRLRIEQLRAGPSELPTAVLLPSWHELGTGPLPVLMSPYGGPALQLVLRAKSWWFGVAQWFAEQGFAVVVADGRGTPGRGPAWDRAVRGDIGGPVLDDQVTALHAAAERYPDLDLRRVAIRGWSFGGFLAALAVLRRPDVFQAAVAGAPVCDQRLYDTYYKERFLGHPDTEPANYQRCSLLPEAAKLDRPLMLIHGLADDNVLAAHTLRFSAALVAAGRPHTVLPLSGATHMVSQAEITENVLRLELDFLRRALT